jgi:hypothetical protein
MFFDYTDSPNNPFPVKPITCFVKSDKNLSAHSPNFYWRAISFDFKLSDPMRALRLSFFKYNITPHFALSTEKFNFFKKN